MSQATTRYSDWARIPVGDTETEALRLALAAWRERFAARLLQRRDPAVLPFLSDAPATHGAIVATLHHTRRGLRGLRAATMTRSLTPTSGYTTT